MGPRFVPARFGRLRGLGDFCRLKYMKIEDIAKRFDLPNFDMEEMDGQKFLVIFGTCWGGNYLSKEELEFIAYELLKTARNKSFLKKLSEYNQFNSCLSATCKHSNRQGEIGCNDCGEYHCIHFPVLYESDHNIMVKKYKPEEKKLSKQVSGWIYIYKQGEYYKIGKSKDEDCRVKKYITENPEPVELIFKHKVPDYTKTEKDLHKLFKLKNHHSEWFKLDQDDLLTIKQKLGEII